MNKKYKNIKKIMTWLSVALLVTVHAVHASSGSSPLPWPSQLFLEEATSSHISSISSSSQRSIYPLRCQRIQPEGLILEACKRLVVQVVTQDNKEEMDFLRLDVQQSDELRNEVIQPLFRGVVLNGYGNTAQHLIEMGADVTEKNYHDSTILHEVVCNEEILMATLLLKNGAHVNAINRRGVTPLHNAHSLEMVNLLLNYGADIDASDCDGDTPLHSALRSELGSELSVTNKKITLELLAGGAKTLIKNKQGYSPLDYAKQTKNQELIAMLQKQSPQFKNSCNVS